MGKQQVGVFVSLCPSSHTWHFHRHWVCCIPGVWKPQAADSGWVIWGRDIRLQHKWLPSIVHYLFLFILLLTFLWDSACKAKVTVPANTQCIHGEIIILVCLKHLFEPSLNYFSGNWSGLNVFIPLPLLVLVCIRRALVTDEHSHRKVFSSLRHCSCFHISSLDKINKN